MKPKLFLLKMPFEDDKGNIWFCSHCALVEGALSINPQWEHEIEVRRINNQKPRMELINILGEENQWMPVLIVSEKKAITDPIEITKYLALEFGGASPHP